MIGMTTARRFRCLVSITRGAGVACLLMAAACGSGDQTGGLDAGSGGHVGSAGSGGSVGSGGSTGSGGSPGSGGSVGSGGTNAATGGANGTAGHDGASGGVTASGGSVGAGTGGAAGHTGTGGSSGASGSGGQAGGHAATGGASGATAGHPGSGGAGGTAAGSGGHGGRSASGGSSGSGGAGGMGPEAPGRVTGYGTVLISANAKNQMIRLQTTMVVPPEPPASGTLFLWPGLQPDGANFEPIDNGVLQPVLTWGPSCAPGKQPRSYSTWWISGQYVNTNGSDTSYMGCKGGTIMSVAVGDTLDMDIALSGTVWTQTVTDEQTGQSVTYDIDLMNQAQNLAYFVIEEYSSAPVSDVVFTNTTITFDSPDAGDCKLTMRGQNDYVSVPVASSDGRSCFIEDIILRAQGVP